MSLPHSLAYMPDIELYNAVMGVVKFAQSDFDAKVTNAVVPDETKTFLYKLFKFDRQGNQLLLNNFDWYQQSKNIFLSKNESPRKMEIVFGFNLERAKKPTIHILMPSESNSGIGVGDDEGYMDGDAGQLLEDGKYYAVYTNSSNVSFSLLITSDNSMETLLIYHFLKCGILSIKSHLELVGFQNTKLSGGDLMYSSEFVPPHIFQRNLMVSFSYEFNGINLFGKDIWQNIVLIPTISTI